MTEFNWTVDDIKRAQRDFSNNFMRLDCIRTESYDVAIDCMTECIEKKAADVQPVKRGRWVQYNRNGEETYIECTNCCVPSRPRHLQMVTRTGEGLPDYCPNCGADMRGE